MATAVSSAPLSIAASSSERAHPSYILTFGFGISVVMWGLGFVSRMPPIWLPSSVLLFVLLAVQLVGGFFAGRATGLGAKAGAIAGATSSVINLLVLGSLLGGDDPGQLQSGAAIWVPGSILVGAVLGGVGGGLASIVASSMPLVGAAGMGSSAIERTAAPTDPSRVFPATGVVRPRIWTGRFAQVACLATLFLLTVGGMVTSHEAGLAVVDWPNSFGHNMFLFPLSRMTGGIYFEHAHRLFGALVGLTTLVLAIHLQFADPRRSVRALGWVALVMVIVQGIMGGLRVTGHFTDATDPALTAPNLTLALVHGVFGQVFFATLIGLAAITSPSWNRLPGAVSRPQAIADHRWTVVLLALLLPQLVLGAFYRHMEGGLHLHLTLAVLVMLSAFVVGLRGVSLAKEFPIYRKLGRALLWLVSTQLLLGIGALIAVSFAREAVQPPAYEVIVTTAHQATGALLLAVATLMALWSRRLFQR